MSTTQPQQPLRVFLFGHPRTASNLFCKLFSEHPEINQRRYLFLRAHLYGPDRQTQMSGEKVDWMRNHYQAVAPSYQTALDNLQTVVADSENEGKIPFLKDHCIHLTRADEIPRMIKTHREVPPEPIMVDNMLDIPKGQRAHISKVPYTIQNKLCVNPTILPDRFLKTLAPVIIIRHPVRQVPSWYKASRLFGLPIDHPDFEFSVSYKFSRRVFEYFRKLYQSTDESAYGEGDGPFYNTANDHGTPSAAHDNSKVDGKIKWPIVIDGEDIIHNAECLARKFCEVTDVDHSGVIYEWEPMEPTEPGSEEYYGDIMKSSGVKKSPPKATILAESSGKWADDWGADVAKKLTLYVEESLADYEYLCQFKLKA